MSEGVYKITDDFEAALAKYTGAPYAVALDSGSNALFLALTYDDVTVKEITIPARTYQIGRAHV
jgi:dTDP-4-amino-4,6-dideoxygalactose transaminase